MISRVAENCFWLNRYVERAETMARLVAVNRVAILDAGLHDKERWKPILVVSGESKRFEALIGVGGYDKDEEAEEYLTWTTANPNSIHSSLGAARENARVTREVISREVWETLNSTWQWLNSPGARKEYKRDRTQFYHRVRRTFVEFHGECSGTMLRDQAFHFMILGTALERANQTARLMDIKSQWFGKNSAKDYETALESAQWMGILRLCAAVEPFFKRDSGAPTAPLVVRLLLQDEGFPRAVLHCLHSARESIACIESRTKRREKTKTSVLVDSAIKRCAQANVAKLTGTELHRELTFLVSAIEGVGSQAYSDFFGETGESKKNDSRPRSTKA